MEINDNHYSFLKNLSVDEVGKIVLNLFGENQPLDQASEVIFKVIKEHNDEFKNKKSKAGKKGMSVRWSKNNCVDKNTIVEKNNTVMFVIKEPNKNTIKTTDNQKISRLEIVRQFSSFSFFAELFSFSSNLLYLSKLRYVLGKKSDLKIDKFLIKKKVIKEKKNQKKKIIQKEIKMLLKDNILNNSLTLIKDNTNLPIKDIRYNTRLYYKEKENIKRKRKEMDLFGDDKLPIVEHIVTPDDVVKLFHIHAPSYKQVKFLTKERKVHINARLKDMTSVAKQEGKSITELLVDIFSKMEKSTFLKGDNNSWRATFDWVFKYKGNWIKIYEGNYDGTGKGQKDKEFDRLHLKEGIDYGEPSKELLDWL